MSTGKILLGVLAGVSAGALLGILFAPDKGSATRKKISKKGQDYADDLQEKFAGFMANTKENAESAKEKSKDFVDHVKTRYDGATKEVKSVVSEIRHAI